MPNFTEYSANHLSVVGEVLLAGETYPAIVTPLNDVLGNARRAQARQSSQGKNLLAV